MIRRHPYIDNICASDNSSYYYSRKRILRRFQENHHILLFLLLLVLPFVLEFQLSRQLRVVHLILRDHQSLVLL